MKFILILLTILLIQSDAYADPLIMFEMSYQKMQRQSEIRDLKHKIRKAKQSASAQSVYTSKGILPPSTNGVYKCSITPTLIGTKYCGRRGCYKTQEVKSCKQYVQIVEKCSNGFRNSICKHYVEDFKTLHKWKGVYEEE